ncbi:MAG: hypothetical protein KDB35_17730 [Acidimicrobiales bacterium]|nr:hypothetical protein [Acidimicrobiales bacterium]
MRTVVVTGSASGLGAAVCERLAARGTRLIGVDLARADIEADLALRAGFLRRDRKRPGSSLEMLQ